YLGPFQIPFSATGDELGDFSGKVIAINVRDGGTETSSDPLTVAITMQPSIIVRELQPLTASCTDPAKRLLGGFPYRITARAVGFSPSNFSYLINGEPSGGGRPRILRHSATGRTDQFGDQGELVFEAVPDSLMFYVANFTVAALDDEGAEHSISLD